MSNQPTEQIAYPNLPLAVYREVAAHLQQVKGVRTQLIEQQSQEFDYYQSQVEGLQIQYLDQFEPEDQSKLEAILNYYAQIYGAYQRQSY